MISLSLSDFIKNILNIQDKNISFPEENYFQIIKKRISLLKFSSIIYMVVEKEIKK